MRAVVRLHSGDCGSPGLALFQPSNPFICPCYAFRREPPDSRHRQSCTKLDFYTARQPGGSTLIREHSDDAGLAWSAYSEYLSTSTQPRVGTVGAVRQAPAPLARTSLPGDLKQTSSGYSDPETGSRL